MKALTTSELNHLMIRIFNYLDPDNKTYYKNIFDSYDMNIFSHNMHIRFIESRDGDSRITITYCNKPESLEKYESYAKLPTQKKKEFIDLIFNTPYELCKLSYNDYWFIQEMNADNESLAYFSKEDNKRYSIIEKEKAMCFDYFLEDM